jgi:DNA (cytosine-5)-methyltransferase 1
MRIGSLFSGAGGLDMAVEEVFGGEVIWHCEMDKAASKVLAYRFPCAPNLGDITQVDWSTVEPVDVLCGGFPCQDVSAAGKRAGIKDGTRSGLWAIFADAIDALRPQYVVIENVRGLLSATAHRAVESDDSVVGDRSDRPVLRAIGAVLGDLSDLGYDTRWATVSASSVGAPHRRERVFIVASDSSRYRWDEGRAESARIVGGSDAGIGGAADGRIDLFPTPTTRDHKGQANPPGRFRNGRLRTTGDNMLPDAVRELLPTPNASDGTGGGQHPDKRAGHSRQLIGICACHLSVEEAERSYRTQWGKYEPAIRRWENLTRPAPAPTEPNKNGNPRLSAEFSEWLMGWPDGWVTDPAIGISRNDQLRIVGNGVCSQQAAAALRQLLAVTV